MLSLFPQILFLAPLGTTLLRIAAALCFAYIAWDIIKRQSEITSTSLMFVGYPKAWMLQLSSSVVAILAALLLLGAWTQGVAIFATLLVAKSLIFFRRYKNIFAFPQSTYFLLLCICLMLVATGAGAFAFDLPL